MSFAQTSLVLTRILHRQPTRGKNSAGWQHLPSEPTESSRSICRCPRESLFLAPCRVSAEIYQELHPNCFQVAMTLDFRDLSVTSRGCFRSTCALCLDEATAQRVFVKKRCTCLLQTLSQARSHL